MPAILEINHEAIESGPGPSVFELAEKIGVRVPTSCLKQGKCRECLVEVVEGMERLSPRTPEEAHLRGAFRLSCRARVVSDEGTIRCHTMRRSAMRIEQGGVLTAAGPARLDPAVRREGEWILLDNEPLLKAAGPVLGLSADIGTTTVVIRLVDLESGATVATQSFENPQRFGGSDVMARIQFDTENKDRLLQRTLLGYLTHAIESFPCDPRTIYEMTVAGNATMRDIFFGLNVYTIGQRPYRSLTEHEMLEGKRQTTSLSVKGRRLRLPIHPDARVYGLPLVGSHVGADASACLLAIDMLNEERTVALMDIGTNTELFVGNRHRILAASCPAGPAFEGGAIARGMPGLDGAIEDVRILPDGRVECDIIGGVAPEGVCGSGLVDALSEMLRTGRMNELGRLDNGTGRFILDAAHDIFIAESDISELAQAKGANAAGLQIVIQNYGIDFGDLDVFYLAGGFARHIAVESARRIGLIPNLPDEKIAQIGNASIEGATLALLSASRRTELEAAVKTISHVELETDPHFFDHFTEGCQFHPLESVQCRL